MTNINSALPNWKGLGDTITNVESYKDETDITEDKNNFNSTPKGNEIMVEGEPNIPEGLEDFVNIFRNAKVPKENPVYVSAIIPSYQRERIQVLSEWLKSNCGGSWTQKEVIRIIIDNFFDTNKEVTSFMNNINEKRLQKELSILEARIKAIKSKSSKK